MRKISKRTAAIVTATVVAVGGAGAAYAAWLSTGSTTVEAKAGSAVDLKILQAKTLSDVLPGNPATVSFTIKNENNYAVHLTSLTLSNLTSLKPTCDAPSTYVVSTTPPVVADIPAGGSAAVTWTAAISLTADPDDDCQGAPFKFDVKASAVSAA